MERILTQEQVCKAIAAHVLDKERMPIGEYSVCCKWDFTVSTLGTHPESVSIKSVTVTLELVPDAPPK